MILEDQHNSEGSNPEQLCAIGNQGQWRMTSGKQESSDDHAMPEEEDGKI
jgi:hypothetical protein